MTELIGNIISFILTSLSAIGIFIIHHPIIVSIIIVVILLIIWAIIHWIKH